MEKVNYFCSYMVVDMGVIKSYGDLALVINQPLTKNILTEVRERIFKANKGSLVGQIVITSFNQI